MPERKKNTVIISDSIDLSNTNILTNAGIKVIYKPEISNELLLMLSRKIQASAVIIRSVRKISKLFIARSCIKVIATASKGTDHIDTLYANKAGVKIINSETGNSDAAAEHTMALILNIYKRINLSDYLVRAGRFTEYNFERHNLRGKSIGILGTGAVGSRVAQLANAFGMKVFGSDINPQVRRSVRRTLKDINFRNADFIFGNCDVVTVHIPRENNYKFVDSRKLSLLRKKSVFINTSRGDVIDEEYLIYLLGKNKIFFAGLDVFSREPEINKKLFGLKNAVLSNHTAGKTAEAGQSILKDIFMQVKNYVIKTA
jgi:phosphoglycerate dehydrogenase-like enzyme